MSAIIDKARFLRRQIEENATTMNDTTALNFVDLFAKWNGESIQYMPGDRVRWGGILYKCITPHKSQPEWEPDVSPSLFCEVLIPDPTITPGWKQPDSTNGYATGDKVTHNGKTWVSDADNNIWEPGAIGAPWTEVTE